MKNRIAVLGGGAMGSLFSSMLSIGFGRENILLISKWKEAIDTIKSNDGVLIEVVKNKTNVMMERAKENNKSIKQLEESLFLVPVNVCNPNNDLQEINNFNPDLIIVMVKSYQNDQAGKLIKQMTTLRSTACDVLTLQNGMGNIENLVSTINEKERVNIYGGTTSIGSSLISPGRIKHTADGSTVICGNNTIVEIINHLKNSLNLDIQFTDKEKLNYILWSKLIVNASINPLTALLNVENGYLVNNKYCIQIMQNVCNEALMVAQKENIVFPSEFNAYKKALEVAQNTSKNISSMRADIMRKSLTEIESINGYIVRKGFDHGIESPSNLMLYNLIKATEIESK